MQTTFRETTLSFKKRKEINPYRKKLFRLSILSIFTFLTQSLYSQQNLFNVPSSDITEKGRLFFQHQINLNQVMQNNSTLSYGLGRHTEIGFNLFGFDLQRCKDKLKVVTNIHDHEQPLNPQFLVNLQKSFPVNKLFSFAIGTQTGFSISQRKHQDQFIYFNYANCVYYSKNEKLKWINGIYFGDKTYLGEGNNIGYLGGIEYKLNKNLRLSADAIYGNNASSVAVIGPCYFISKHIALSGGWQIPFAHSKSNSAFVFEFTYL